MNIDPRHERTVRAGLWVKQAVVSAAQQYELTYAELMSILAAEMASWTKYQIRDERKEAMKA